MRHRFPFALAVARFFVVAAAASACGGPLEPEPGVARGAVVGGALDPGSAAVGALVAVTPLCGEPGGAADASAITCSGTLIAPRVVLTAAHCVEGDAPQVLSVVFATEVAEALPAERVRATLGWLHPAWSSGVNDIGALLLAEDAPVAPMPLDMSALPLDLVEQATRVVGFGVDEEGQTGTRRSGTARVTAVDAGTFRIAADPGMSCSGDSGGPVFLEVDGAERLIGVTSFGDLACATGTTMRVDVHADFLQAILDEAAQAPPARPPLDPTADACSARCEGHADCPLGMACVLRPGGEKSCAAAGLEAGRFGALCEGPEGDRLCAKAGEVCRLWLPCAEADEPDEAEADGRGCAVARGRGCARGKTSMGTLAALLALWVCRGSRRARSNSKLTPRRIGCRLRDGMSPIQKLSALVLLLACGAGGCDRQRPAPAPPIDSSAPATAAPQASPNVLNGRAEDGSSEPSPSSSPLPSPPPSTPAGESLRAAPPWAVNESDGSTGAGSYAPQLDKDIAELLFAAAPKAGAAPPTAHDQGMLVCLVDHAGSPDGGLGSLINTSAPELTVRMTIGKTSQLVAHGPEDTRQIYISIPLVSLASTEPIRFQIFDRDVGPLEDLGELSLAPAERVKRATGLTTIECRAVGRAAVEARAAREVVEGDAALDRLASAPPKLNDDTLGAESSQAKIRGRVARLAALVGWAEPRVVRRLERASQVSARIAEASVRYINAEAARRGRRASLRDSNSAYTVEVAGVACGESALSPYAKAIAQAARPGEEPVGCVVRIQTTNVGDGALMPEVSFPFGWKALVYRSDGQTRKAPMITIEGPETQGSAPGGSPSLPRGAKGTVVLGVSGDIQPTGDGAPRPRLLVLDPFMGNGPVFLSLDVPAGR